MILTIFKQQVFEILEFLNSRSYCSINSLVFKLESHSKRNLNNTFFYCGLKI